MLTIAIVVVVVFLILAFIGYLMGPQKGQKPLTQRDERILRDRQIRADAQWQQDASNPALAGETERSVVAMADFIVFLARQDRSQNPGMPDTAALALAFRKVDKAERHENGVGLGVIAAQVADLLADQGVMNRVTDAQLGTHGVTEDNIRQDPGRLVEVAGVRDLDAWTG